LEAEFGGFGHETKLGPLTSLFVVANIHAGSFHGVTCLAKYLLLNRKGVAVRPRPLSLFTHSIAFLTLYFHQFREVYIWNGFPRAGPTLISNPLFRVPRSSFAWAGSWLNLILIPSQRSLRSEGSGRAARGACPERSRRVAFFATQ